MPVKSSNSSVLKWPDHRTVDKAVREWVVHATKGNESVVRIGYFGSYAREDWGVGSDLDLLIIVQQIQRPFIERPLDWDASTLPVPTEILVYTQEEWDGLLDKGSRFHQTLTKETVWVYTKG